MKKILFFYPSNKRSVQIETTIIELSKLGHTIHLLTTSAAGDLHKNLEAHGITTSAHVSKFKNSILYYINQIFYLISFCRKEKVDLLFANLQHANFIAVFAQYFIPGKLICFRHHFKFNRGNFGIPLKVNRNEILFDKNINFLAKHIVVPSKGVYDGMIEYETINAKKLSIVPYLYDFSRYGHPNLDKAQEIREAYKAKLLIIMVARLIPFKRHILMLPVIKKLVEEGLDIKMIILDEGPEKENLENYIQSNNLTDNIFLLGFRRNFLDYMAASDLILHPSITEASNNVIKEIGLQEKAVAVCSGVGDFDEYIENNRNGFLMDISTPEKDAEEIIKILYNDLSRIEKLGSTLKNTIIEKFGNNEPIIEQYKELIENT